MNKIQFIKACEKIINKEKINNGIGTLGEKTLHAVLKNYIEPHTENHEIKIGSYVADIVGENGIVEIQTRGFDKLRKKLEVFLEAADVTIVHPIAKTKWLIWINQDTGEATNKRKSPKKGSIYEIFYELYKIKQYLNNPNLRLKILLLEIEEYRHLNGWSADKKKGSSRFERIPVDLIEEVDINNPADYYKFLPESLPPQFSTKDYKKATGISQSNARTALNILYSVGAVKRVGKQGKLYLYEGVK